MPDGARIGVRFMIQPSMNILMPINLEGKEKFRILRCSTYQCDLLLSGDSGGVYYSSKNNFCIFSTLAECTSGKTMFLNLKIVSKRGTIGEDCYEILNRHCVGDTLRTL